MNLDLPTEFVLFDLEWTSWEGFMQSNWQMPGKYREVIQIGAIKVGEHLEEKGSFDVLVKPAKNPQLSDYVQELTGITQEILDAKGKTLAEAVPEFLHFVSGLPLVSWMTDDAKVLRANCELAGISAVIPNESVNVRAVLEPILKERGIDPASYNSGTLIEAFGKKGERAHDALNDMRNLLEVLKEVQK
jgi:DNA polymerase III epsilon subunit-like protein